MRARPLIALLAPALLAGACDEASGKPWAIAPDATLIHCVNPSSGTRWDVVIDPGRGLVDGFAAQIGPNEVDWNDPTDKSRYALDRATGQLAMTRPSSTGGYTNFDSCASAPTGGR
jgi:hypothetical protein